MREIKFRAWDNVNKFMFLNAFGHPDFLLEDMLDQPKIFFIMQYTGLKDKNGVEIYEGDVIEHFSMLVPKGSNNKLRSVIAWGNYGWTGINNWKASSVIGNIYSDPELCPK